MMPVIGEVARGRLLTNVADALLHVIVRDRGGEWVSAPAALKEASQGKRIAASLGFTLLLRGNLCGRLRLEISEKDAETLFRKKEDLTEEELKSAWLQLMESAVICMPKRSADSKTFFFSVESYGLSEIKAPVPVGAIQLESSDTSRVVLSLLADAELAESLRVNEKSSKWREQQLDPQLDRVIDVPLAVTLRFGQRNMRLCEVLELNAGGLVELNRKVEEPVDLILDERVIAKGEVVIVDGNYGLRVTEILERNLLPLL